MSVEEYEEYSKSNKEPKVVAGAVDGGRT